MAGEGVKYRPIVETHVDGNKVVLAIVPRAANERDVKRVRVEQVSAKVAMLVHRCGALS